MSNHATLTNPNQLHYAKLKLVSGVAAGSITPDFSGQIICLGETGQLYRATGTEAGAVQPMGITAAALDAVVENVLTLLEAKANEYDLTQHTTATGNVHNLTLGDIGAASSSNLSSHTSNSSNPHGVTASQVGAIRTIEKGAPDGICPLGINGIVPDEFLPSGTGGGGGGSGGGMTGSEIWDALADYRGAPNGLATLDTGSELEESQKSVKFGDWDSADYLGDFSSGGTFTIDGRLYSGYQRWAKIELGNTDKDVNLTSTPSYVVIQAFPDSDPSDLNGFPLTAKQGAWKIQIACPGDLGYSDLGAEFLVSDTV
ncbi:hypothetical protein BST81_13715 [Leptolyngbya sp. 'hensonii']|uniref:hypothetical protein n=1 Tax=Leptolyngbya sp. 'hensonii' TaxID=1922337 RepID=UPI00094FB83A|nr:hypothetical protein [Leptolyngbya sp. 'hensonii']OLP18077.1 hypothetical protein BST81_13715 [Leptolyngbya sp. 'hensonii']